MTAQDALPASSHHSGLPIALGNVDVSTFSQACHRLVTISELLQTPDEAIDQASLHKFARTTPQYPGMRALLDQAICADWLAVLSPMLTAQFGQAHQPAGRWAMQAWYSIVTTAPGDLAPIQRLPHVDGTDPGQIAMMLYLHRTGHGGTAFFRHRATRLEALTEADFPRYAETLQRDVARAGLPPAAYTTDGAPHFERTHAVEGRFNQAVFYRGNILHSGVIDNTAPLPADPRTGRLTINAFFWQEPA